MFQVGDIIDGRWRLVSELSTDSGQGNTFLVADDQNADDEARYVIKLLRVDSPQTLARFGKEVRASFALQHSNIVRIKDSAFEGTSTPYLVTEYCSGGRLTAEKIRDLSTVQRLRIFEQICSAIAHAHRQGVIHRDIKPDNIFFESAESLIPVLGDFGLCFFTNDEIRPAMGSYGSPRFAK